MILRVFQNPDPFTGNPNDPNILTIDISQDVWVRAVIQTIRGQNVKYIHGSENTLDLLAAHTNPSRYNRGWDGTNEQGERVARGLYRCAIYYAKGPNEPILFLPYSDWTTGTGIEDASSDDHPFQEISQNPDPFDSDGGIFTFQTTRPLEVRAVVQNITGQDIKYIHGTSTTFDAYPIVGRYNRGWDGTNEQGERVAEGKYRVSFSYRLDENSPTIHIPYSEWFDEVIPPPPLTVSFYPPSGSQDGEFEVSVVLSHEATKRLSTSDFTVNEGDITGIRGDEREWYVKIQPPTESASGTITLTLLAGTVFYDTGDVTGPAQDQVSSGIPYSQVIDTGGGGGGGGGTSVTPVDPVRPVDPVDTQISRPPVISDPPVPRFKRISQGFGADRRLTLFDLVTRLRMRLSEPHMGTWGVVTYEYDSSERQEDINELALMISEASEYLCRDLYDKDFAFFESSFQHPIVAHTDKYTMPSDFMAIESVFHIDGSYRFELRDTNIKELKSQDPYGVYSSYQYKYYEHYEIRGNTGSITAEGQIPFDVGEEDEMVAQMDDGYVGEIRVGDTLVNQTDGSTGQVINFGRNTIEVDELTGGKTNVFAPGDTISVESAAQPFEAMHVFPTLTAVAEDLIVDGPANNWQVEYTRTPTRVKFRIDKIPPHVNPRRDRIYVIVQPDDGTEIVVSGFVEGELKAGWNNASVYGEVQGSTKYNLACVTSKYIEGHRGTEKPFLPDELNMYEATGKDHLDITYSRLPTPMVRYKFTNTGEMDVSFDPDAVCEWPPYAADAILEYAKLLAYQKKTGMARVDQNMLAAYEICRQKIQDMLRKRSESGNKNMFTNPHSIGRSRILPRGVWPNFTDTVEF